MSFHIILPSNTRGEGNRTNSFTVHLPRKLQFNSEWCVGLEVFVYPRTWPNLGTTSQQGMDILLKDGGIHVAVPSARLNTPEQLEKYLTNIVQDENNNFDPADIPEFVYRPDDQKFYIAGNRDRIIGLELTPQLSHLLGFAPENLPSTFAKYSPDLSGGISSLYVYAPGLIEPVMVGDTTAPLMRIATVRGKNDEVVEDNYFPVQYHKLLVKEVSEITIEIRDSTGALIPFEYGTCRLTLHFKKMAYF